MTTYAPEYLDLVRDRAAGRVTEAFRREIAGLVGEGGLISEPAQLHTYECDGLTGYRVTPALVVLPATTEEVASVVRVCAREGVPFVARGAGTGLSGGSLPVADGIVIGLARMRRILAVDVANQRAVVQPGVTNLGISAAVGQHNLYFAPDPSSQVVCTIGGNVAENSGGAHCLKYGFTTNHVYALTFVTADGSVVTLGGDSLDPVGPDLRAVVLGSEGTLGIVTEITVRLLRRREAVRPLVADLVDAGQAG
jgi:glycolate oxidase